MCSPETSRRKPAQCSHHTLPRKLSRSKTPMCEPLRESQFPMPGNSRAHKFQSLELVAASGTPGRRPLAMHHWRSPPLVLRVMCERLDAARANGSGPKAPPTTPPPFLRPATRIRRAGREGTPPARASLVASGTSRWRLRKPCLRENRPFSSIWPPKRCGRPQNRQKPEGFSFRHLEFEI